MGPTAVTELFGIRHPVLSAPMARAATPELAAAVSEAGGLGGLGSAVLPAEELGRQAAAVRALTDAPFNLNFFVHPTPEIAPELAARARELLAPLYAEDGLGQPPAPSVPPIDFDEDRLDGAARDPSRGGQLPLRASRAGGGRRDPRRPAPA